MSKPRNETEELLNQALRLITVYLVQSELSEMRAELMSDGEFYVVEIKIRKVVE